MSDFLDSTWATYGGKTSDPAEQIRLGHEYMKARYGTTEFEPDWYDRGTGYIPSLDDGEEEDVT